MCVWGGGGGGGVASSVLSVWDGVCLAATHNGICLPCLYESRYKNIENVNAFWRFAQPFLQHYTFNVFFIL